MKKLTTICIALLLVAVEISAGAHVAQQVVFQELANETTPFNEPIESRAHKLITSATDEEKVQDGLLYAKPFDLPILLTKPLRSYNSRSAKLFLLNQSFLI